MESERCRTCDGVIVQTRDGAICGCGSFPRPRLVLGRILVIRGYVREPELVLVPEEA